MRDRRARRTPRRTRKDNTRIRDIAANACSISIAVGTSTPEPTSTKRPTALLVGHPNGWVELFAVQRLDARFPMLTGAEGADGERLSEGWAALRLSRRNHEIFLPSRLEVVHLIRRERPSKVARDEPLTELHGEIGRMEAGR